MDFIERIFHISPDGGSGALEAMLVIIPLLAILVYRLIRHRRAKDVLREQ